MTDDTASKTEALGSHEPVPSPEEKLRERVSTLTQYLILAAFVVVLQFGVMVKLILESPRY